MAKQPKRLGRGLSSLISADLVETAVANADTTQAPQSAVLSPSPAQHRIITIAVDRIRPNPSQPRRTFDDQALSSLAASILERGTLQPIIVRPAGTGFEIVAGERRLRAAKLAGIAEIPAIARSVSDSEMLELALIENVQRADLNAIDRARAYHRLHTEQGLSHEEIAGKMGEDRATVSNYIRLLSLCDEALSIIASGDLGTGHGKVLLAQADPRAQADLARRAARQNWSVRQLEAAVRLGQAATRTNRSARRPRPAVADMEERLSSAIGTRVTIREGRRRHTGSIAIEYYGLDDFERITTLLGVPADKGV